MTGDQPLACARVRILLEAYADGYLAEDDPTLASAVRRHLAGCADCRRQHEQAISIPFRLRALSSPRPPESLIHGVMRSITPSRVRDRRAWTLVHLHPLVSVRPRRSHLHRLGHLRRPSRVGGLGLRRRTSADCSPRRCGAARGADRAHRDRRLSPLDPDPAHARPAHRPPYRA